MSNEKPRQEMKSGRDIKSRQRSVKTQRRGGALPREAVAAHMRKKQVQAVKIDALKKENVKGSAEASNTAIQGVEKNNARAEYVISKVAKSAMKKRQQRREVARENADNQTHQDIRSSMQENISVPDTPGGNEQQYYGGVQQHEVPISRHKTDVSTVNADELRQQAAAQNLHDKKITDKEKKQSQQPDSAPNSADPAERRRAAAESHGVTSNSAPQKDKEFPENSENLLLNGKRKERFMKDGDGEKTAGLSASGKKMKSVSPAEQIKTANSPDSSRKSQLTLPQKRARDRTAKKAHERLLEGTGSVGNAIKRRFLPSLKFKDVVIRMKSALLSKAVIFAFVALLASVLGMFGTIGGVTNSAFGIFYSPHEVTEETVTIGTVKTRVQAEYNARIAEIESTVGHSAVFRHGEMPDWIEVVAVFAVHTTTRKDGKAADVVMIDQKRADLLCEVFWDMCEITYEVEKLTTQVTHEDDSTETVEYSVLHIYTTPKSLDEMPDFYRWKRDQREMLYELMKEREMLTELCGGGGWYVGGYASVNMTDAELYELAAYYGVTLPSDLSIERKNVLAAAFAGVQINIPYHYTWRSYYKLYLGVDGNDFGSLTMADHRGRDKKGTDCSGFVGWAYYTGGITWSNFGYGESNGGWSFLATPGMRGVSATSSIPVSALKPGDIGYISNSASGTNDHTGIYLGTTSSGARMWLHCGGSTGAVCSQYGFGVFYTIAGMDSTFGERQVAGTMTGSDTELLAKLIYYEGRGYYPHVQELIAQVAVNRMNSPKFKNQDTITDVINAPGQYASVKDIFTKDIRSHREFSEELWQKCYVAAERVVNGTTRDEFGQKWPTNVLYQHSFGKDDLGTWFRSYTDASGKYTEHFAYG